MTYTPETVTAANSHAALAAEIARLHAAIDEALAELGVPQPGYQAPVANAVAILAKARRG